MASPGVAGPLADSVLHAPRFGPVTYGDSPGRAGPVELV